MRRVIDLTHLRTGYLRNNLIHWCNGDSESEYKAKQYCELEYTLIKKPQ
jgi:hypothetical protein